MKEASLDFDKFNALTEILEDAVPGAVTFRDERPSAETYRRNLLLAAVLEEEGELSPAALLQLEPLTAETRPFLRASRRVCLIERKDGAESTGVLIGPDVVLTAAHTMMGTANLFADPRQVTVRVDQFGRMPRTPSLRTSSALLSRGSADRPQPVVLASSIKVLADGKVQDSRLDYIIFKIAEPLGIDRLGSRRKQGRRRGWMGISFIGVELQVKNSLTILQHPQGRPQHFATGTVSDRLGFELHYDADAFVGSSGAAILNSDYQLTGIHIGQISKTMRVGTGIREIFDDIQKRWPENADEALQPFPPPQDPDEARALLKQQVEALSLVSS